jgi:hypothetical protein
MVARCGQPNVVPDNTKGTRAATIAVRYLGWYESALEATAWICQIASYRAKRVVVCLTIPTE